MDAKPSKERVGWKHIYEFAVDFIVHWDAVVGTVSGCAAIAFWQGEGHELPALLFGCIATVGIPVAFFRIWNKQRMRADSSESALGKLRDEEVSLSISVVESFIEKFPFRLYRVRVENLHRTKTAKKVSVSLLSLASDRLDKRVITNLHSWPRVLPIAGQFGRTNCDIFAWPAFQEFDLFFVKNKFGLRWDLGLSPIKYTEYQDRKVTVENAASWYIENANGLEMEKVPQNEEFLFEIQASADDAPTVIKKLTLIVPPLSEVGAIPYFTSDFKRLSSNS